MKRCFIDAGHLIALINPKDQWHRKAVEVETKTAEDSLLTTEDVLAELLTFYAESGEFMRKTASDLVRKILLDMRIEIAPRNENTFSEALGFYESRPDKGYSLTDCISMNICWELDIREVLTHDHHFEQEGFEILG